MSDDVIERRVREQLATEIEAAKPKPAATRLLVQMGGSVEWAEGYEDGLLKAVDIVRGVTPTPTHFGHGPTCGCPIERKDADA